MAAVVAGASPGASDGLQPGAGEEVDAGALPRSDDAWVLRLDAHLVSSPSVRIEQALTDTFRATHQRSYRRAGGAAPARAGSEGKQPASAVVKNPPQGWRAPEMTGDAWVKHCEQILKDETHSSDVMALLARGFADSYVRPARRTRGGASSEPRIQAPAEPPQPSAPALPVPPSSAASPASRAIWEKMRLMADTRRAQRLRGSVLDFREQVLAFLHKRAVHQRRTRLGPVSFELFCVLFARLVEPEGVSYVRRQNAYRCQFSDPACLEQLFGPDWRASISQGRLCGPVKFTLLDSEVTLKISGGPEAVA